MILLDSSFIVAYSNKFDENYEKAFKIAKEIYEGKYGTPVISDYIFDEVVTVTLYRTKNLKKVAELGEILLTSCLMLRVDEDVFEMAWKIFKNQRKRRFSFTDCTSIAICQVNGISNIATFDEDFLEIKELNKIGL